MKLIGLTGGIGMGKSTTADLFKKAGIPVFDADAEVHKLQAPGGRALAPIEEAFPGVVVDGVLDRNALGAAVFNAPEKRKILEGIMHPLVGEARIAFFEHHQDKDLVVLDIPLLFETGGNKGVHVVVVVSCDPAIQRERVMARPGMTQEKMEGIIAQQTPDAEKRAGADYVIDTGLGLAHAESEVRRIVAELRAA